MDLHFTDENGTKQSLYIGSYGIGITRAMGVIVEKMSDDKGLVWPVNIAPYQIYLVSIGENGSKQADALYDELTAKGVEVLYDDRDERPGAKFADSELLGIPTRVTVSDRLVEEGKFEVTDRASGQMKTLTKDEFLATIST